MQDATVKPATACLILVLWGCSDSRNTEHCASLEVAPAEFVTEGQPLVLLDSGADVTLVHPPQGGRVILVGAQIKNITTDIADIETTLFGPDGSTYTQAARTIALVPVPGEPGVMQPDLRSRTQVSHMTMCPVRGDRDVVDQTWTLEVRITEYDAVCPRTGSTRVDVVPRCLDADPTELSNCRCLCQVGGSLTGCP
jgi:hypothetical protein